MSKPWEGTIVRPPFKLYRAGDLALLGEPAWLIQDIIQEESLTLLYGPKSSFKSFIAIDMALSVANARDWHGQRVMGNGVVYIAAEGGYGMQKRVKAWNLNNQPSLQEIAFLLEPVNLTVDADISALMAGVNEFFDAPPKLFIFDTLSRCMSGADENSQRDMSKVIDNAGRLQREFGAAVLLIHHTGYEGSRARGSSVLGGATDAEWRANREVGYTVRLVNEKMKDSPDGAIIGLGINQVEIGENVDGAEVMSLVVAPNITYMPSVENDLTVEVPIKERVLNAVRRKPGMTKRGLCDSVLGKTSDTLEAVDELLAEGRLVNNGSYSHYRLEIGDV